MSLMTFVIESVTSSINSTRYIYVHSTESSRMRKKPRALVSPPIQVQLHEKHIYIDFISSFESSVDISIYNNYTKEKIYEINTSDITTWEINLDEYESGSHAIEFSFPNDTLIGNFELE